ncbi:hypothetical protein ACSBR1_034566 [Camellia fascicularis]
MVNMLIVPLILLQCFCDQNKFVFWYTRRTPGVRTQTSYEDNIKKIVDFSTVEAFWVCYCHLARPSSLPSPTDLHLFKEGIRPLWEDSANCNGGKWIIRFKKAVSGRFWEDLLVFSIPLGLSQEASSGNGVTTAYILPSPGPVLVGTSCIGSHL